MSHNPCWQEKKTKRYYEDELWVIFDCDKCHDPVVMYKITNKLPHLSELAELLGRLANSKINLKDFNRLYYGKMRTLQRSVQEFWHFHLEK